MNAKREIGASTDVSASAYVHERDEQVERVEIVVGRLLRYGTLISTLLIAVGLIIILTQPGAPLGNTLVTYGLIALVGTPLLRVGAAMLIYFRTGDIVYTIISLLVLIIVFAGMILGQVH